MSSEPTAQRESALTRATEWLAEAQTEGLANKLVAAGTHDRDLAGEIHDSLDALVRQVDLLGPEAAARGLFGDHVGVAEQRRNHYVLATAAAAAQVPLWTPPRGTDPKWRRMLEPIELGLLRLMAAARPDRIIPVALAEQGATTTQMASLDHQDFLEPDATIRAALPATARGTAERTVALASWSHDGARNHLAAARLAGRQPCYGGYRDDLPGVANAIGMRIQRVLDDAGIPATVASLRVTVCVQTLREHGPIAAMRAGGFNSVAGLQRFLGPSPQ